MLFPGTIDPFCGIGSRYEHAGSAFSHCWSRPHRWMSYETDTSTLV